jgi:hypothetical protein
MFLLLGTISLAPIVGSLLLYYFWKPQAFTNYGELVPAIPLAGVTIPARDGNPLRIDELRGNWVFLMVDTANCDDYCQSKLYVMRQVRLTQGKDQQRIERVWLVPDGVRPPPGIEAEYRGTRTILPAAGDFLARLPASGSPRDHIYVIDPFGNLMMRFPRDADPQRVKKDVAKLMKNSSGWIRTAN